MGWDGSLLVAKSQGGPLSLSLCISSKHDHISLYEKCHKTEQESKATTRSESNIVERSKPYT